MTRHIAYTVKFLATVETALPVNDFVGGGIHLWPLIRCMLYSALEGPSQAAGAALRRGQMATEGATGPAPWAARFAAVNEQFAARFAAVDEQFAARFAAGDEQFAARFAAGDEPAAPPPSPLRFDPTATPKTGVAALVLVREDEHQYETPEGWFAPIIDPWIDQIAAVGPVIKLELTPDEKPQKPMRRYPQTWVQPWTRADLIAGGRDEAVGHFLDAVDAAGRSVAAFAHDALNLPLDDILPELRRYAYKTILYRLMFARLIAAFAPRCVLTQCYYHEAALGLIWAAADAGVPTAEIQHGATGALHGAYSHWTRVPDQGYTLLPQVFLTWNRESAGHILRWLNPGQTRHHVVVTGRPDLVDVAAMPAFARRQAQLAEMVSSARHVVLVTVSPAPAAVTALPTHLLEAMARAPADWVWLVRCHPLARHDTALGWRGVEALLRQAGVRRFDVRLPTLVPLAVVLPYCTEHVTETSSSYLECCAFGAPTVFVDPSARQLGLEELIAQGAAAYAETADDILEKITSFDPSKRDYLRARMTTDPAQRTAALGNLLNK